MRLLLFLALALFSLPALTSAEDTPPPVASITQTAPVTPPPAPVTSDAGTQTARKEDDETAGMLARIKAYATGKTVLANNISGLEKKVADLTATLADRETRLAALETDNKKMRADLTAFGDWLTANGQATPAEAATNPGGTFQAAVGAGVATEIRKIGIPAAAVTTSAAVAAASADSDEVLAAAVAAMNSEKDPGKKGLLALQVRNLRAQITNKSAN